MRMTTRVIGSDYAYSGTLQGLVVKSTGAIRYVVEDANRRLFIHNATQLRVQEGFHPVPDAWSFELAQSYNTATGEYSNWKLGLSRDAPCVPEASIRNLQPMFSLGYFNAK